MKSIEERRLERQQVKEIALSEKHFKLRVGLFAVFLVVAMIALGVFLFSLLRTEPGWQTVSVTSTGRTSAVDFSFNYYCGHNGANATDEYSKVASLYTEAAEKTYVLFDKYEENKELFNVYYLNHNPNKTVTVDTALYNAFKLLADSGSRYIYLAPVYEEYGALFSGENDVYAAESDPYKSASVAAGFKAVAAYAADEKHVNLKLLADNKVCLEVSSEYEAYAKANGIDSFIDFYRLKNAFIIDYFAQVLTENGYTNGYITSEDGFARNLDDRGEQYSLSVVNNNGGNVHIAATVGYTGVLSTVSYHAYPLSSYDSDYYYEYENGDVATSYIDTADGLYKSALPNLLAYSKTKTCTEILLATMPYYIADSFSEEAPSGIRAGAIELLWFDGETLNYTEEGAQITGILQNDRYNYVAKHYPC